MLACSLREPPGSHLSFFYSYANQMRHRWQWSHCYWSNSDQRSLLYLFSLQICSLVCSQGHMFYQYRGRRQPHISRGSCSFSRRFCRKHRNLFFLCSVACWVSYLQFGIVKSWRFLSQDKFGDLCFFIGQEDLKCSEYDLGPYHRFGMLSYFREDGYRGQTTEKLTQWTEVEISSYDRSHPT